MKVVHPGELNAWTRALHLPPDKSFPAKFSTEIQHFNWRCFFLWLSSCMSVRRRHKARLPKLRTAPLQRCVVTRNIRIRLENFHNALFFFASLILHSNGLTLSQWGLEKIPWLETRSGNRTRQTGQNSFVNVALRKRNLTCWCSIDLINNKYGSREAST